MQNPRRFAIETAVMLALLAFTLFAATMFITEIVLAVDQALSAQHVVEGAVFLTIVGFLIYGNVVYQVTRLAHWRRMREHQPTPRAELDAVYESGAAPLTLLVPSYKEELRTVRQTLLSGALQDYPDRRVVLLIDDPCHTTDVHALAALESMRRVVVTLDAELHSAAQPFLGAQQAFKLRLASGNLLPAREATELSALYLQAAAWFERQAIQEIQTDHTDVFFAEAILHAPMRVLTARAQFWQRAARDAIGAPGAAQMLPAALQREYGRLAALFNVSITSFERKRYVNLSHEPNKAMNLNTFIGLMGGSYREVLRHDGLHLQAVDAPVAEWVVPRADLLITLDADSLLLPEYALRLIHLMTRPGNERLAVAQTPYSAIPKPQRALERIAGATTDIQYLVHQGFTQHGATFWVGANAVLRRQALDDIGVVDLERGHAIRRFIQDRTVIEDTESTVDLLGKGWTLHNYPDRMAYSATPQDFGALAVQRGRWANGGLIILPKLLRYLVSGPLHLHKLREGFLRVHYLTSIAGVNVGLVLLLAYPFPDDLQSAWLPATAAPYFLLYGRDLWLSGYRGWLDALRVYALNLLLLPVNVGGVMRSLHQAVQGHKIPFRRTPKVAGRTRLDARYVMAEFTLAAACLALGLSYGLNGHWAQAVFAAVNGAFYVYGIHVFLGWRNGLSDLRSAWSERAPPLPTGRRTQGVVQ